MNTSLSDNIIERFANFTYYTVHRISNFMNALKNEGSLWFQEVFYAITVKKRKPLGTYIFRSEDMEVVCEEHLSFSLNLSSYQLGCLTIWPHHP